MKAVIICALIAVAIVSTVALLPASGWIFKNQVDVFFYHATDYPLEFDEVGPFVPSWLHDSQTYIGNDRAEKLAHAYFAPTSERVIALEGYANDHPNDGAALV